MKVGIDAHMVGAHETGNETYVRGLIQGLARIGGDLELLVYHVGRPWSENGHGLRFERLVSAQPLVRLGLELPLRSVAEHPDVLHMTYASPIFSASPIVLTVHDICFTTNPEWFSARDLRVLNAVVPRSIRNAKHVIAVSNTVRESILDRYHLPPERVTAISNGPGPGSEPITAVAAKQELAALGLKLDRPFLLAVGNLQPRKNLVRLIQAFNRLRALDGIDLVIVGPQHYRADDVFRAAAGESAERIHFTDYVTDRQLAACYESCTAFVFPSLYEGFGIPAIEAMAHGTPVACSNAGALPEVCDGAALLFDPTSVDAIADAVEKVIRDPAVRQELAAAGPRRAATFTWDRAAESTLDVYRTAKR
jgi:glycosyltransferase involved in cell wall biosynthesis